jgi:hypothetical protein
MTDKEFDEMFDILTDAEIIRLLARHIASLNCRNGLGYIISNESDLRAMVEQQEYERLTGRE